MRLNKSFQITKIILLGIGATYFTFARNKTVAAHGTFAMVNNIFLLQNLTENSENRPLGGEYFNLANLSSVAAFIAMVKTLTYPNSTTSSFSMALLAIQVLATMGNTCAHISPLFSGVFEHRLTRVFENIVSIDLSPVSGTRFSPG